MSNEENEPVHLVQDAETGDRFLVYETSKGPRLDIRYEGETLWMTQAQMGQLFGVDRSVITKHLANVYAEGELDQEGTCARIAQVRLEGSRKVERQIEHYNLDAVISVGYRCSSSQATVFRRWATGVLVQFAKKGFVVDALRLKNPDNYDRISELRDIIRDIRADEANVYRELKQICALCQDYDGGTDTARKFFWETQAKLIFAVTSHTPAEIIAERSNCEKANMGLQTWSHENIRKADIAVSKNYLVENEIKELNRLTTILLDIFDDQLDLGHLVVMADATRLLNDQLKNLKRAVLRAGGSVTTEAAKRKAEREYEKFDELRRVKRHREADERIASLAEEAKGLPKGRR